MKHINFPLIAQTSAVLLVLYSVFVLFKYVLSPDYFFYADDWSWLYRSEFFHYSKIFTLLPKAVYNDRPIGSIFIKIIYDIFGLNQIAFHKTYLTVHFINTILSYLISCKLFKNKFTAMFVSFIFGNYFIVNNNIFTVGTIFDLLCNLFLLSIFLIKTKKNNFLFNSVGLGLFYLAIRTKEMAITFPIILVIYDILINHHPVIKSFKINRRYLLLCLFFVLIYLRLYLLTPTVSFGIYSSKFNLSQIINNLSFYIETLFYSSFKLSNYIWTISICIYVFSFFINKILFFAFTGFFLSISPVIFLSGQKSALYLYIPLFYFATSLASSIDILISKSKFYLVKLVIFAIITSLCFTSYRNFITSQYYTNIVNFGHKWGFVYSKNLSTIKNDIPDINADTEFFITNLPQFFNVFDHGPCYSLMVIYHNKNNIKCNFYNTSEILAKRFEQSQNNSYYYDYLENETILLRHTKTK